MVIACGAQSARALSEAWDGRLLVLPHPACRWLRADHYRIAGEIIRKLTWALTDRVQLWQDKGGDVYLTLYPERSPSSRYFFKIDDENGLQVTKFSIE